ncbi:MAG: DUF192 domain-containing protein [Marinobacter sp.]|uniref:DUF192 domain-containing protein n=1 Tax=Marinobacter sp. TaxID=50741 RepID=UPI0034A078B4
MSLCLADTFWTRLRGLLGRSGLEPGEGLLISPCRDVHTCGMRFPIDIVFLDGTLTVIRLRAACTAWRFYSGGNECRHALELAAGAIAESELGVGERLELRGAPDNV